MSKEVNADFYEFLRNHETGLYPNKNDVIAYVHIDFCDLSDFVEMLGYSYFDEGGLDAKMTSNTICIEINDLIEGYGHYLSSYKNCFSQDDWEEYEERIVKTEGGEAQ